MLTPSERFSFISYIVTVFFIKHPSAGRPESEFVLLYFYSNVSFLARSKFNTPKTFYFY